MAGRVLTGRVLIGAATLAMLVGACSKDTPATAQLYDKVPVPAVPDRTAPVEEPLQDGEYWAVSVGVTGHELGFAFAQAFFGPACEAELGAAACADEPGVREQPATELSVAAAELATVTVAAADRQNFAITGDELARLAGGGAPSSAAPDGYTYVPYPFLVSVRGGIVTEAHQIWVP
jgi:hypothetical protein